MKVLRNIGTLAFVLGLFTAVFVGIPWHVVVADDPVAPVVEQAPVLGWHPHQVRQDQQRQLGCDVGDEVGLALVGDSVDHVASSSPLTGCR